MGWRGFWIGRLRLTVAIEFLRKEARQGSCDCFDCRKDRLDRRKHKLDDRLDHKNGRISMVFRR